MPKSKTKKRNDVITVLIPDKPTVNLTSTMRSELYATPESFENTISQTLSSTSNNTVEESNEATKMKMSPKKSSEKKDTLERSENEVSKHTVTITKVNDVQTYDADVIGTFSQSSGTISYDSIKSMKNESLQKAQINGKYIQNTDKELHKIAIEQLLKDGPNIPKTRIISDIELNRIIGQEVPFKDQETIPVTPLWGLYETILTKKCINEVVENFFATPRDDIELVIRLSRRDMYPRLHIELAPIYADLHDQVSRFQQHTVAPFDITRRRQRFDDLLRSASMCYAQTSDAITARSPSYDYLSSAYSYLVAFVKSVIPKRNQTSTKMKKDKK